MNRDAKLRADTSANAKVKKTIKKGESVTIHEAKTDSTGKLWYYLTVDDSRDEGWMQRLRGDDRDEDFGFRFR